VIRIVAIAGVLAMAAPASAQSVDCKKTETQAECHDRLKCKADEELGDCQKRLLQCTADESLDDCKKRHAAGQGNNGGNDRGNERGERDNDRGNDRANDRGNDRANDRDNDGGDDRDSGGRDDGDRGGRRYDRDDSRRSRGRRARSGRSSFEANKTFGLGFELGEPDGLNGKYFVSPTGALDFGVGYIYDHYYYGDGFHLYGDYLWHPVSLASTPSFELPFYVGVGLRFWDFHYCVTTGGTTVCDYGGSAVGIRVPLGISFDFNNAPLDIFLQLVPTLDFLGGDYYTRNQNREHFGIDGSVGLRFWFK